jgi:putative ABC transport system permease protein
MTVLRIAFRNVLRHRRRAFITALTMMAGIGIFIGMDSLMNGMDRVSVDNLINLRESSAKVFSGSYYAERKALPLDHGIPDPQALGQALRGRPDVRAVTARTQFLAEIGNYLDATPVVGTAIDPRTDPQVFTLKPYVSGSWFAQDGGSPGTAPAAAGALPASAAAAAAAAAAPARSDRQILIGAALASKLGAGVGDTVVLSARTRYEARNADEFTIAGLLHTTDPALNQGTAFITLAAAEDFLDLGGLVTEMDVRLRERVNLDELVSDARAFASSVSSEYPGLRALSFDELGGGFLSLLRQKRAGSILVILVILLIAAVGIMNTVLMSVYERIREVGVLKAMGLRSREVVWMFTLEGLLVGLLGSLLGAALGLALDAYLIFAGIPLEAIAGNLATSGFSFWGNARGEWNPGSVVFAVVFGLAVALVAAVIPARKAAKMTATDALHFV